MVHKSMSRQARELAKVAPQHRVEVLECRSPRWGVSLHMPSGITWQAKLIKSSLLEQISRSHPESAEPALTCQQRIGRKSAFLPTVAACTPPITLCEHLPRASYEKIEKLPVSSPSPGPRSSPVDDWNLHLRCPAYSARDSLKSSGTQTIPCGFRVPKRRSAPYLKNGLPLLRYGNHEHRQHKTRHPREQVLLWLWLVSHHPAWLLHRPQSRMLFRILGRILRQWKETRTERHAARLAVRPAFRAPPRAGEGVHGWLFRVARHFTLTCPRVKSCACSKPGCAIAGGMFPRPEIVSAVQNALACAWQPTARPHRLRP